MPITATHIAYYHICRRKLWLFGNGINMEHTSDTVAEGKLIHETSYPQRAGKYTELSIGGSKIDFYDPKAKVVHETKKSDKMEAAHEWQLRYYLLLLEQHGIEGATGLLEYPKLRQTSAVTLSESDRAYLAQCVADIEALVEGERCPPVINAPVCRKCSYYELCYVAE